MKMELVYDAIEWYVYAALGFIALYVLYKFLEIVFKDWLGMDKEE